jgi:hypothetical protein
MENNIHYTVDSETFAIRVFDGVNKEPFLYQPHYPNGDTFDSVAEATSWAEEAIASHDPNYGFYPPVGKGLPSDPKPTTQQIAEAKLASIGLTVEDLKALLQ